MPRGSHLKTGVTDRHRNVARGILSEGKPIRTALLDAGYSQASANQGMARIRRSVPLAVAYAQEVERLRNSPVPPAQIRAQIVRAKLLENVAQNRELSLWQPESQAGIIVLSIPPALQDPEVRRRLLESED